MKKILVLRSPLSAHAGKLTQTRLPLPFLAQAIRRSYWNNFNGKVMKMFDEKGIPSYRRILAAEFIKHPMNTEDSAKVLEEELQ